MYTDNKRFAPEFEKGPSMPTGFQNAVCSAVIDIGVQETSFEGKKRQKHGCYLFFEFIDMEEEDPEKRVKTVWKRYSSINFSTNAKFKSGLQEDLESWRGFSFSEEDILSFDLYSLYGVPCTILLEKNDKGYTNVTKVVGKDKNAVKLVPQRAFDEEPPDFIKKIIERRIDRENAGTDQRPEESRGTEAESFKDDIPF